MQSSATNATTIFEYFSQQNELLTSESEVIAAIMNELSISKQFVSNKDIILKLLEKLESETDIVQLDIYRQALEVIVQHTPDDITD